VAIVFLFGFAALATLLSIKFDDNPFFRGAIVIFCAQYLLLPILPKNVAFFHMDMTSSIHKK